MARRSRTTSVRHSWQKPLASSKTRLLLPARAIYGLTETALGTLGLADNLAVVFRRRA